MNNQERKFRVIRKFIDYVSIHVYKVGDIITTTDMNDLVEHFEDRAGELLHHLQEITPAEDILKRIIGYIPSEGKFQYSSNRFNLSKSSNEYYFELDVERSLYSDDLIPVFKIRITKEEYDYLKSLEKKDGQ